VLGVHLAKYQTHTTSLDTTQRQFDHFLPLNIETSPVPSSDWQKYTDLIKGTIEKF
jgi:hypothetical protein